LRTRSESTSETFRGANAGVGTQDRIGHNRSPERVVPDQTGAILRHFVLENPLGLVAQRDKSTALLGEDKPLERADVVGMHGKKAHVLVHALVHGAVELGERGETGADLGLLVGRLLEQALGHHEAHVLARQQHLGEPVLHPAQAVCHVLEPAGVEDGLLDACHEAEAQMLGDLADLAQEGEIEDQVVVVAGAKVVEQLVDNQQHAVAGMHLREGGHHVLEGCLVVHDPVGGRKRVADAMLCQEYLQLLGADVAQRHLRRDLDAVHLELARDCRGSLRNLGMAQHRRIGSVLGHQRQHRHQVRLAGAVVADDQDALVVDRRRAAERSALLIRSAISSEMT
jgi:hypothetical protein